VLDRIQALPGVKTASLINSAPFGRMFIRDEFEIEGLPKHDMDAGRPKIDAAYFETMGIPLLAGREFTAGDTASAPKVAIISEHIAREYIPGGPREALGRRVRMGDDGEWLTVVGVVADVRQMGLDREVQPMLYVPYQQEHGTLYLRSGEIHLDEESGAASGEITIDVVRSETGNKKRDKTMHAKVLHSAENPWIVFEAQRMEGTLAESGASDVQLVGTLTLVGSEHPFTLPMAVELDQEGHFTARTSFSIPYVEWGLENPSIAFLRVAKEVEVSVDAKGVLKADGAATMSAGSEQP